MEEERTLENGNLVKSLVSKEGGGSPDKTQ